MAKIVIVGQAHDNSTPVSRPMGTEHRNHWIDLVLVDNDGRERYVRVFAGGTILRWDRATEPGTHHCPSCQAQHTEANPGWNGRNSVSWLHEDQ